MGDEDVLASRFEELRPRLRTLAYRMLGSPSEAEDAIQETWLRLARSDAQEIENLDGWLTTVLGRVCLNVLRSRRARREEPLPDYAVPELIVTRPSETDPEHEALLADAVGVALLVILDTLSPAERVAFVLRDMFAIPFEEIAGMLERSPEATRQLASRARRRVRGSAPTPDADRRRQREVVDAFFAAARGGDLERLVTLLDPQIVLRADFGPKRKPLRLEGPERVIKAARAGAAAGYELVPVLVNGIAGALSLENGRPFSLMAFTVVDGRIVAVDVLADRERLAALDVEALRS
jgi:RNA polymerase sigma-70 factor (ECF subfamily)